VSRSDHESVGLTGGGRPSPGAVGSSLKGVGLVLAWVGGVACGWQVFQESSLLDAALRGAAAWLALMLLWLAAIAFCQRYVFSADPRQQRSASEEAEREEAAGVVQP
jgi:hypothetical protein